MIHYIYLTTEMDPARATHMKDLLSGKHRTKVNPPLGLNKQSSGALGHFKMVEQGLVQQDRKLKFQPYIMLEDDVSFTQNHPDSLEIPDDADIVYVGISSCGLGKNRYWWTPTDVLKIKHVHGDTCVRIYNMLSTHAIMICSPQGASIYGKCMIETYYKNKNNGGFGWDILLARIQPYFNVYALKNPIFFQDSLYGGEEWATKIEI